MKQTDTFEKVASPQGLVSPLLSRLAVGAAVLGIAAGASSEAQAKDCAPHKQISFKLVEASQDRASRSAYEIIASSCHRTTPRQLKHINIVEKSTSGPQATWKFKRFAPHDKRKLPIHVPDQPGSEAVTVKAYGTRHHLLGRAKWTIEDKPAQASRPAQKAIQPQPTRQPEAPCTPDPEFRIGIQDDRQFVWQKQISRDKAFDLATSVFGATLLRINLVYAEVQKYGYKQFIDTVDAALAHNYKVQLTLMPTPSYMQGGEALSADNPNPDVMRDFAKETAAVFGQKVMLYSVGNEPNLSTFMTSESLDDYVPMFEGGRDGIHEANPNARVISGELAPGSTTLDWLASFQNINSDGDSVHPYGDSINHIADMEAAAGKTLYLSEYGVQASDPDQWTKDLAAMQIARCAGVKELVFFELLSLPEFNWNTGVVPPPGR